MSSKCDQIISRGRPPCFGDSNVIEERELILLPLDENCESEGDEELRLRLGIILNEDSLISRRM
jgi:hypothetical protein